MILFLAPYPNNETIKDGMFQRIANIDSFYTDTDRTYLQISIRRNFKISVQKRTNLTIVSCNLLFHLRLVARLFKKSGMVYIHSVFNVLPALLFILLCKKKYIVDFHGAVPEEVLLRGSVFKSEIFRFCEKIIIERTAIAICVTNAMVNHYKFKYPKSKSKYIVFNIMPNNIDKKNFQPDVADLDENESEQYVNIVYSGNTQKWQNIDLMCDIIAKNLHSNFKYYILTGNLEAMTKIFTDKNLICDTVKILSLKPQELEQFYKKCHYGFILREDIVVNRVACPTKLIEYLNYGIKPVVLTPTIGDFNDLGYDFVECKSFSKDLMPMKSKKNSAIIQNMRDSNKQINIAQLLE